VIQVAQFVRQANRQRLGKKSRRPPEEIHTIVLKFFGNGFCDRQYIAKPKLKTLPQSKSVERR